jgi:hypothetical protein
VGWRQGGAPHGRLCAVLRLGKTAPSSLLCLYDFASLVRVSGDSFLTTSRFRLQSKRNRQDGDSGSPFRTTPCKKSLNTRRVRGQRVPFRTTPRKKSLNTRRVRGQRRPLSNNAPCEVVKQAVPAKGVTLRRGMFPESRSLLLSP